MVKARKSGMIMMECYVVFGKVQTPSPKKYKSNNELHNKHIKIITGNFSMLYALVVVSFRAKEEEFLCAIWQHQQQQIPN
jgi:hypothetical protein